MFANIFTRKNAETYSEKIRRLRKALDDAEAVIVGAGAGLSTSAGFTYDLSLIHILLHISTAAPRGPAHTSRWRRAGLRCISSWVKAMSITVPALRRRLIGICMICTGSRDSLMRKSRDFLYWMARTRTILRAAV